MMNEYYVLYDKNDECIGTYNRDELKKFCNVTRRGFDSLLCRLRKGEHKYVRVNGIYYRVYIYVENNE